MSLPPDQIRSQLNRSDSLASNEEYGLGQGQQQKSGQLRLDGNDIKVSLASEHLGSDLDIPQGPSNSDAPVRDSQPSRRNQPARFNASQIKIKTSGRWAKLKGSIAALGTGLVVGGGVATGMMIGGVIGTAIPIPIIGTVSGMVVGAAIGAIAGLISGALAGGATYSHHQMRSTSRVIEQAKSDFSNSNRQFSAQEKDRLESVTPKQWKSLLVLGGKKFGTNVERQAIRTAILERVATEGHAAAKKLKSDLI